MTAKSEKCGIEARFEVLVGNKYHRLDGWYKENLFAIGPNSIIINRPKMKTNEGPTLCTIYYNCHITFSDSSL
jgi:hypothetical protein